MGFGPHLDGAAVASDNAVRDRNIFAWLRQSAFERDPVIVRIEYTARYDYVPAAVDINGVVVAIAVVEYLHAAHSYVLAGQVMLHPHRRTGEQYAVHCDAPAPYEPDNVGACSLCIPFFLEFRTVTVTVDRSCPDNADIFQIFPVNKAAADIPVGIGADLRFGHRIVGEMRTSQKRRTAHKIEGDPASHKKCARNIRSRRKQHRTASN